MARISAKSLSLDPSPSEDVVGYRMYYMPTGETVDYSSPFISLVGGGPYDLEQYPELQTLDGIFNVAFSAIDDAGNESDLGAQVADVPLDFTVPLPPTGATFGE